MGGELWGAEDHLRGLWSAAVRFEAPRVQAGTFAYLRAQNRSALPFDYEVRQAPEWFRPEPAAIRPHAESLLRVRIAAQAPAGATPLELELELKNLHPGPGRNLRVHVPLTVDVGR
jgi:hypothetical protein